MDLIEKLKIISKRKYLYFVVGIAGLIALIFFIINDRVIDNFQVNELITEEPEEIIKNIYGIPIDSYNIIEGRIFRNQHLSQILKEYKITNENLNRIITDSKDIFDLRKIRSGNKYFVFVEKDSLLTMRYFIYEHDPVEYLLLDFTDSVKISYNKKDVNIRENVITGTIKSSLWNVFIDKNADPVLANKLSEIYAWNIDFFGLQPQDSFAVCFEENYIDTVIIGINRIKSAYFRHANTDFYAIPFIQDSTESFYDTDGNSLRRAFLKAPLNFSRISSRFSHSRMHPILKIRRPHFGVDYSAPKGTAVYAIGDGKIIEAKGGYNKGGGNMIKIRHNSVYTTAYLHLSGFAKDIKTGKYVKQGDIIGFVGSTGLSTGPHLDFRFYKNGSPVDPLKVEAPPVEPVRNENKQRFDSVKNTIISELKNKVFNTDL